MSFAKRKSFTNLYVIQEILWFSKLMDFGTMIVGGKLPLLKNRVAAASPFGSRYENINLHHGILASLLCGGGTKQSMLYRYTN